MDIQLNFVNNSNDANNSQIVIFQKNVSASFSELSVAWLVIQNCGAGDNHPFCYPTAMQVSASDSYGNYMPKLSAQPGQSFSVALGTSGDTLQQNGVSTDPSEVQVVNLMPTGACNANIYRNGTLLATKTGIAPQQQASFQFKPTIWIGVASQVTQGSVMNSAILSSINTEISLLGIASADIVMTGGGPGPTSSPFAFSLQNVVMS
jgi:hypothetical protein